MWFPRSRPRQAKGGIRSQSQRGGFGSSWWARRWTAALESFDIGARLSRGRSYARRGQVLSIDVSEGEIEAKVQGSRPQPYEVTIQVQRLDRPSWLKVATEAAAQAIFASKLLAGQMPEEMEQIFRKAGVSLFPERSRDLKTECSCPDWSNPCKHVAAVYYLLGEEFDRDPFLIFRMRGMSREAFMELLGGAGSLPVQAVAPEPLPSAPSRFWKSGDLPQAAEAPRRVTEAALPRRLGNFPFWRGGTSLHEFLDAVYTRASAHAAAALSGEDAASGDH